MNTFCASTEQVTKSVSRHWLSAKAKSRVSAACHTPMPHQRYFEQTLRNATCNTFFSIFVCLRAFVEDRASEWMITSERERENERIPAGWWIHAESDSRKEGNCGVTGLGKGLIDARTHFLGQRLRQRSPVSGVSPRQSFLWWVAPKFLPVYILLYCRELNARFIDCLRGWILSAKCQLNKGFPWAQKNIRLPFVIGTKPWEIRSKILAGKQSSKQGFHPCRGLWIFISLARLAKLVGLTKAPRLGSKNDFGVKLTQGAAIKEDKRLTLA